MRPAARRRPWLFVRLAAESAKRRPVRTVLLALTVAIGVGAGFATVIVRQAIEDSLALGVARMGADILVVPRATLVNLTTALLVAEPTPHTLEAGLADEVARLPGVDAVAPQRSFALEQATGSQIPDVIVFDPARDFTVQPWLRERLDRPLGGGDAIVGARRPEAVGTHLWLGDRALVVHGRLGLTGVGTLDRSVLVTFETAEALAEPSSRSSGPTLFGDTRTRVSALLVRLSVGARAEHVRFALASRPDLKVVEGPSLSTSIRQTLTAILAGAGVLSLLVLLATVVMVGVLYSTVLVERRRELGLWLALGVRPRQLLRLILAEAVLATGLGGVGGMVLGVSAVLVFQRSLGYRLESLDIPFLWPAPPVVALYALGGVLLAGGVGLAGALLPAWRISHQDPYALVCEHDQ
ncbi:MAG: ABC transporter permease [Candidatus Rokuibacteriota bacterium]